MNELKHLSLLASLREVFSGTDWNIKKECIEAVGSVPVGIYLKEILNGYDGLKGSGWRYRAKFFRVPRLQCVGAKHGRGGCWMS